MTSYDLYQVDAFAAKLFTGNPAAVMPLQEWLPDEILLNIAKENNLAETAYVIAKGNGQYKLRWFTPGTEVDLCGHATLATSHILYTQMGETSKTITYETRSGPLRVERRGQGYGMDFPAYSPGIEADEYLDQITTACGRKPVSIRKGDFLLAIYDDPEIIREMKPNKTLIEQIGNSEGGHQGCLLVTAPGDKGYDFISRFFAPGVGIPEDPVTGSAHCMLAPFWAERLGKTELTAFQASPRGGDVLCRLDGNRVHLEGRAVTYLRGTIEV